jgi:hypothetical protein
MIPVYYLSNTYLLHALPFNEVIFCSYVYIFACCLLDSILHYVVTSLVHVGLQYRVIHNPSGISDLCGTVAGMVSPKGNMLTEGETLQVSALPYRCSIGPPLVTYRAPDQRFSHTFDSLGRWPRPACSFRSAHVGTLLQFRALLTRCFVHRWFCVVLVSKPQLRRHDWLSFGKFQGTERFLIPWPRHVSARLPPNGETYK